MSTATTTRPTSKPMRAPQGARASRSCANYKNDGVSALVVRLRHAPVAADRAPVAPIGRSMTPSMAGQLMVGAATAVAPQGTACRIYPQGSVQPDFGGCNPNRRTICSAGRVRRLPVAPGGARRVSARKEPGGSGGVPADQGPRRQQRGYSPWHVQLSQPATQTCSGHSSWNMRCAKALACSREANVRAKYLW